MEGGEEGEGLLLEKRISFWEQILSRLTPI